MWYEGAIKLPGPAWKVGYNSGTKWVTHEKTGLTYHTAEYDLPDDKKVLRNVLFSASLTSWPFTITKPNLYIPAMLFQHYPVDATCWHAGFDANLWTVGVECEGIAPDKITGSQYDLLVELSLWVGETLGWPNDCWHRGQGLPTKQGGLYEHCDWMSTLCQVFTRGMLNPQQLIADLKEDDMKALLFRMKDRPEVYFLAGGKLFHIPDQATFLGAGYRSRDVVVLLPGNPVWKLPVEYPGGVPTR